MTARLPADHQQTACWVVRPGPILALPCRAVPGDAVLCSNDRISDWLTQRAATCATTDYDTAVPYSTRTHARQRSTLQTGFQLNRRFCLYSGHDVNAQPTHCSDLLWICCNPQQQQEAFEKCWAHSPLRAAALPFARCRYCRTPPAHRCSRRQRQRVTEGTAMAP